METKEEHRRKNREYMVVYLQKLRSDPAKYKAYLERHRAYIDAEKDRQRWLRDKENPEKLALVHEKARLRWKRQPARNCALCGREIPIVYKVYRKYCLLCEDLGRRLKRRERYAQGARFPSERGTDWDRTKYLAMARDESCCRSCGTVDGLVVHHKHEYFLGGTNALSNLVTLCNVCHSRGHKIISV